MKKIINAVDQVENQMIDGMVKAFPQYIRKVGDFNVVARAKKKEGKVALISGGGSGHEPAHGGYVGEGNGKVSIYKKNVPVLRHIPEDEAPDKLLELIESEQ